MAAAESADDPLARLQATAIALAQVMTPVEAARAALAQAVGLFGATAGAVYLRHGDELRVEAELVGRRPRFPTVGIAESVPVAQVALSGQHTYFDSVQDLDQAGLHESAAAGVRSAVVLALEVKATVIGVIALTFEVKRSFERDARRFAGAIAAQCALALDRALLLERERAAGERSAFLAAASDILALSLDPGAVLQQLAELVVPRFADWCTVELADDGETNQLAVAHVDPAKVIWAATLRDKYPPKRDEPHGLYQVIRTGKSEIYETIPEGLVERAAVDAEHLALIRQLQMHSALIVPLTVRGRTIGGLTAVWAESKRTYSRSDLGLFEEVARRAALAVDNAMLVRDLEQAVHVREDFLAAAGHELKTPLAALQMQVESIQRMLARGITPPNLEARLDKAARAGTRLGLLIDELLDVSRITAGRLRLDPEPLKLDELVREVAERFADQLASAGCTLRVTTEPTLGMLDRSRIDQVISNLVANAIKYGRGGGVELELELAAGEAVLRVRDHGIGIAPAEQQRIFERFERVVENRSFGGFGLGLWIARQIVEASGGTITVMSAPRSGATFEVRLPLGPLGTPEAA